MSYERVKNFRIRLKERIVYVMGDSCQCCGYDRLNSALELHHLNSQEKEFTLGQNTNISWNSAKEEIQKCILVCANCHREIHAGLIDNSTLQSSFNIERALEIDKLVDDVKHKKITFCKSCGAEIYKGSELCIQCFAQQRRIVDRPNRTELKEMIRTIPFTQIAKQYNVSDNAIRKWCKSVNLPDKVSIIKNYSDEEWENI